MRFQRLIEIVGDEPTFEAGLLLAGDVDSTDVRRQLSRWTSSGLLFQIRRGLYALAPPYRKVIPHPFLVANRLVRGSYVSGPSALAHYGLIPEHVPVVTSVTASRPSRWETPLGAFEFRHLKPVLMAGYRLLDVAERQQAFVAAPEKALLDLLYLIPGSDRMPYLLELRLQNLDRLDLEAMRAQAERFGGSKLTRATNAVAELARAEAGEYRAL